MMKMTRSSTTTWLAGAGLIALLAGPALAQTTPAATSPAPAPAASASPSPAVEAHINDRVKSLHDQLHITAAEEQNWQGFASVMKNNMEASAATMASRQQNFDSMNAVQDLQSYADMTNQQAQQLGKLVGPFQTLYAQLTPDQKASADRIFRTFGARGARAHG